MNAKEIVRAWQDANPRVDHNLIQGSPEWLAFRATKFGASDAAAMLGISPYQTRNELLRQKFTGTGKEVSADLQRVFDKGHEAEALARPIVEGHIDAELYPVVCSRGDLSASCDGLTMDDDIAWEHKQYNADLFAAVSAGILPDHHMPQCQQALLITGAERLLFVCSDGTEANFASLWVEPDYEYMAKLIAGWKQFEADLAAYQYVEIAPAAVAAPIESLPALRVELTGEVIASNLAEFESITRARIQSINTNLVTDQHFADAEKMTGFLKDAEDKLKLVKQQALDQTASISELFKTIERISEEARQKRLELEKLVKARKESRRAEIVQSGRARYAEHATALNTRLGRPIITPQSLPVPDFGEAIKGKRNFASMVDAVDATLANAKLDANALADRVQANMAVLDKACLEHANLFPDYAAIVYKQADDLAMLIQARIAEAKAKEEARVTAERERIRAEEEAKAKREAAETLARLQAEEQARLAANKAQAEPQRPHIAPVPTRPDEVVRLRAPRPTDSEIVMALRFKFSATHDEVISWLREMNLENVPVAA